MGTMLFPIATAMSITATGKGTPIHCKVSPFQGGQNHNALLINNTPIAGGGVIVIEGNPLEGAVAPGASDAAWYTIATLNATSVNEQEILIPNWIRTNITTLGTGTVTIALEGVQ